MLITLSETNYNNCNLNHVVKLIDIFLLWYISFTFIISVEYVIFCKMYSLVIKLFIYDKNNYWRSDI
jgi:hypothetical protein